MTGAVQHLVSVLPIRLIAMAAIAGVAFPGSVTSRIRFTSSGHAQTDAGVGSFTTLYDWLCAGQAASGYEINYAGSGLSTGSAENTWLPLSSDQTWSVTKSSLGVTQNVGSVSIRRASDAAVMATYPMTLLASVSSP